MYKLRNKNKVKKNKAEQEEFCVLTEQFCMKGAGLVRTV
jgi:hypothetical protein